MRVRLLALTIVGLCLAAALTGPSSMARSARAQEGAATLTINQLDASLYPELRAVVTVVDGNGVPVAGLVPSQFQVYDEGTQLEILEAVAAQDEDLRLDVVVTIDVSGSMVGQPLASAKAAATEFVESLGPNDRAALVSFSDEVTPVLGLTEDKDALTDAIANLEAVGGTALFEAVQVSTFLAASAAAEGSRASVVLLSDGENDTQASDATSESSLTIASGSGIPVYPIAFGDLSDPVYLQQVADMTRGEYREATTGTIGGVYGELSTLLRSQYVVTAMATMPADAGEGSAQVIAFVGTTPASAVARFQRGVLVAPPPPEDGPEVAPEVPADSGSGAGNGKVVRFGLLGVAALAVVGGGVFGVRRVQAHRRELARQKAVVEPNVRLATAQGVPRATGSYKAAEHAKAAAIAEEQGTGRLVERGGEGRVIPIGAGPIVIGSSPRVCNVLVHNGGSIAPEHARIWLRGRGYVLHHVGGMSRKTYVSGHEADWVGLEDGDEIVIGKWRFQFRDTEDEESAKDRY